MSLNPGGYWLTGGGGSGGGGASPGGASGDVQRNDGSGGFAGSALLNSDGTTLVLTEGGATQTVPVFKVLASDTTVLLKFTANNDSQNLHRASLYVGGPNGRVFEARQDFGPIEVLYGNFTQITKNQFAIVSGSQLAWSSDADFATAVVDTALKRPEAGVLKATNGSSGGGCLATGSSVTGSRPTVATVGAQWYDTTLHYPVWWDGSQWRNAAGTVV